MGGGGPPTLSINNVRERDVLLLSSTVNSNSIVNADDWSYV